MLFLGSQEHPRLLHAQGEASQLPGCCHSMVMISGRPDPDHSNEKALSVLDCVVNAQVREGEM